MIKNLDPDLLKRYFCFVWTKNNQYKVFNFNDELKYEDYLKQNGWTHMETIDPTLWIEALMNHQESDALDMIKSIKKIKR